MRLKKIPFILILAVLFQCPLSPWAQVPPSFETPPTITQREAQNFLDEYISQYMKMDINAFMSFFSTEAIENRMLTYTDIQDLYRRTFENSDSLLYHLEIYSVQINRESAMVTGRYEVTQTVRGSHSKKIFKGNIQWDLVRENGSLKIKEINYGRDYGEDQMLHPYP